MFLLGLGLWLGLATLKYTYSYKFLNVKFLLNLHLFKNLYFKYLFMTPGHFVHFVSIFNISISYCDPLEYVALDYDPLVLILNMRFSKHYTIILR